MNFFKETDIGFGELSIFNDRLKVVNFLYPHIMTSASFITSLPKSQPIITLFVEPFDYLVWICIIFAFILIFVSEWIQSRHYLEMKKIEINWSIISIFLRQQFSCRLPSINSLRIMLSSWLMACLVLTSSYGGCLYSLMAFPSHLKTIDSISKLVIAQRNGEIQVIITNNSYFHRSFEVLFENIDIWCIV